MKDTKPRWLHVCVLLMVVAGVSNSVSARCIDEENVELQDLGGSSRGYAADAGGPRAALQTMVKEALQRSQAIGASKLLAEAAALDVKETKAGGWPVVTASGFLGGSQVSGPDVDESRGKQGRASVNVTAPLYDGGRVNRLTDWRQNLAEAARFGQLNAQEQVALQTVSLAIERSRFRL
jgi:outer membrane protein, adhesin transport system